MQSQPQVGGHKSSACGSQLCFGMFQGLLLAGFNQEDAEAAAAWMEEMEPGFRVSHATDGMMNDTLAEVLYDPDTQVCIAGIQR